MGVDLLPSPIVIPFYLIPEYSFFELSIPDNKEAVLAPPGNFYAAIVKVSLPPSGLLFPVFFGPAWAFFGRQVLSSLTYWTWCPDVILRGRQAVILEVTGCVNDARMLVVVCVAQDCTTAPLPLCVDLLEALKTARDEPGSQALCDLVAGMDAEP